MWGWHCVGTAFPAMEMVFDERSSQPAWDDSV